LNKPAAPGVVQKGSLHISLDKTVGGIAMEKTSNTINPFDKEFNNEQKYLEMDPQAY
jgi:hypothetical protein